MVTLGGRGFVPNVQPVHSEIIVTLAVEPQAAVSKDQDDTGRNGLTVDMG